MRPRPQLSHWAGIIARRTIHNLIHASHRPWSPHCPGARQYKLLYAVDKGCRHLSRRYGSECKHAIWILMGKICLFSFNVFSMEAFHQKLVFISKRCDASAAPPVVFLKQSVGDGKQTAEHAEPRDGFTTT